MFRTNYGSYSRFSCEVTFFEFVIGFIPVFLLLERSFDSNVLIGRMFLLVATTSTTTMIRDSLCTWAGFETCSWAGQLLVLVSNSSAQIY